MESAAADQVADLPQGATAGAAVLQPAE